MDEEFSPLYQILFSSTDDRIGTVTAEELNKIAKRESVAADRTQDPTIRFCLWLKAVIYYVMCANIFEQTKPEVAVAMYSDISLVMSDLINKVVKQKSEFNSKSQKLCNGYLHVIGLQCSAIISQKLFSLKCEDIGNSYSIMEELFKKNKSDDGSSRSKYTMKSTEVSGSMSSNSSSVCPNNMESMYDFWNQIKSHHSIARNANTYWKDAETVISQSELEPFFASINTNLSALELSSDVQHLIIYIMIVLAKVKKLVFTDYGICA